MYRVTNLSTAIRYSFPTIEDVYGFFMGRKLYDPYVVEGPGFKVRVTFK